MGCLCEGWGGIRTFVPMVLTWYALSCLGLGVFIVGCGLLDFTVCLVMVDLIDGW